MDWLHGLKENILGIFLKNYNINMISGKGLFKSYGEKIILSGIDVTIKSGEITVLTGPSGAGKTTLLNIVSLIEKPDKGLINIDSNQYRFLPDQNNIDCQDIYPSKIGIVFQSLHLFPHLNNYKNIILGLGKELETKDKKYLKELISVFKLEEFIYNYPNQSSRGQQQRIALVRALIHRPKYLFLDEITSALDIEHIAIVLNYLNKLKADGVGIFIITHLLPFAQKAADQIIFMEDGKIIESGSNFILFSPKTQRLKRFIDDIKIIMLEDFSPKQIENDWNNGSLEKKLRLVYRLLDIPNLEIKMHNEIYDFVVNNWELFKADLFYWLNNGSNSDEVGLETLINYSREGILNPKYPHGKKWIYLLSLRISSSLNYTEAKKIASEYINDNHELIRKVANQICK